MLSLKKLLDVKCLRNFKYVDQLLDNEKVREKSYVCTNYCLLYNNTIKNLPVLSNIRQIRKNLRIKIIDKTKNRIIIT